MNKFDWLSDEFFPRCGVATELSWRTIKFEQPLQPDDVVQIESTREAVRVLRLRKRGGGWVVKRGIGSVPHTWFGSSPSAYIGQYDEPTVSTAELVERGYEFHRVPKPKRSPNRPVAA